MAEIDFAPGLTVRTPLLMPDVVRINQPAAQIAREFASAVQEKILDRGSYFEILKYELRADPVPRRITVKIKASADGLSHPEWKLEFDALVADLDSGTTVGFVPVLGIAAAAHENAAIDEALRESILLEFARCNRLQSVRSLLATQWFQGVRAASALVPVQFHAFSELEAIRTRRSKKLLPSVAAPISKQLPVAFGIDRELEQLGRVFRGRFRRSVLLIGPSGAGKTALVEEFSRKKWQLNGGSMGIWETTASRMLQKLTEEGGWQENLAQVCQELRTQKDVLFIRNLAELFEVGQYVGNDISMAEFLRDPLLRGEVTIITECTREEAAIIEAEAQGYLSLFHIIDVTEPDDPSLKSIVEKKVKSLASQHRSSVARAAVDEAIRLQRRYSPYSGYPGKTIQFFESLLLNLRPRKATHHLHQSEKAESPVASVLGRERVLRQFCEDTGMPRMIIDPEERLDLEAMEKHFQQNIFGQQDAVRAVVDVLASVKAALARRGKPLASLLFVGPTGVGKTEMAKVLAQFMFVSRQKMIRFDMSEYSDSLSLPRLTGDGQRRDGLLTAAVRQDPFSVLLFDELGKSHPAFYDLLLQVLGEGRLSDSRGRVADFCSSIIIMISNIGTGTFGKSLSGFVENSAQRTEAARHFTRAVQDFFRPELFNRLDQIIPFAPLDQETVRRIVDREIALVEQRDGIRNRPVDMEIDAEIREQLCRIGHDPRFGARQLQRIIRQKILAPLSRDLNRFPFDTHLEAIVECSDGEMITEIAARSARAPAMKKAGPTDLIGLCDRASDYRRQAQRVEDGACFVQLQSQFDLLERRRKAEKENFWKNQENSSAYSRISDLSSRCEQIIRSIENLEIEIAGAWVVRDAGQPEFAEALDSWKKSWDQIKTELYAAMNPDLSGCVIGIYGDSGHLDALIKIYLKIAELKNFAVKVRYVCLRAGKFGHVLSIPKQDAGSKIIGAELSISGPSVHQYFREEAGFHKWLAEEKRGQLYYVHIDSPGSFKRPDRVERILFFKGKQERRIYRGNWLIDYPYKLEVYGADHACQLAGCLSSRFQANLTENLV